MSAGNVQISALMDEHRFRGSHVCFRFLVFGSIGLNAVKSRPGMGASSLKTHVSHGFTPSTTCIPSELGSTSALAAFHEDELIRPSALALLPLRH